MVVSFRVMWSKKHYLVIFAILLARWLPEAPNIHFRFLFHKHSLTQLAYTCTQPCMIVVVFFSSHNSSSKILFSTIQYFFSRLFASGAKGLYIQLLYTGLLLDFTFCLFSLAFPFSPLSLGDWVQPFWCGHKKVTLFWQTSCVGMPVNEIINNKVSILATLLFVFIFFFCCKTSYFIVGKSHLQLFVAFHPIYNSQKGFIN